VAGLRAGGARTISVPHPAPNWHLKALKVPVSKGGSGAIQVVDASVEGSRVRRQS
jgi:hypothetical protein